MGIYVVGDIHGCFSQFMELVQKIEKKDDDAKFILIGDIVSKGPEDEKMLAWAYDNITADGKFQMVLGNHDDVFIETFGCDEFETIFSLGRILNYGYKANKEEYNHLADQLDLMYEYAKFLSRQPLYKKIEVSGQKYVIAHAWYPEHTLNLELEADKINYNRRFESLWHRDWEEYNDGFEDDYEPFEGELLIHGHTPTLCAKKYISKIHSPGKVWRRENSVNIDCGLVFNVINFNSSSAKYGNLAAYELGTNEITYLWDIVDDYKTSEEEYLEDRIAREIFEKEEKTRLYNELWEQMKEPYLDLFYQQEFGLEMAPGLTERRNVEFSFMNDYMHEIYENELRSSEEDAPIYAFFDDWRNSKTTKFYTFIKGRHRKDDKWVYVELPDKDFRYKVFTYNGEVYLFGINGYENDEYARGALYVMDYYRPTQLLLYQTKTPNPGIRDINKVLEETEKIRLIERDFYFGRNDAEELDYTGIMTFDCFTGDEFMQVKMARYNGDAHVAQVTNEAGEVLVSMSRAYSGW